MSPGVPHMGYTHLNLLDLSELLQILVTLTAVIKPLGRAIVILNCFYGELLYREFVGKSNFSEQCRKLINRYKRIGQSLLMAMLHSLIARRRFGPQTQ